MRKLGRIVVLYFLIPVGAILLTAFCLQRSLIYRATQAVDLRVAACELQGQGIRDVQLIAGRDDPLRGWLVEARGRVAESARTVEEADEVTPLVIFFPGNAGHRFRRWEELVDLSESGYDVLVFDYRGYGDNAGRPREDMLTADAKAILAFAVEELNYRADSIVVYGESLGGAVALSLWSEGRPKYEPSGLILRATFTSLTEVAGLHYPLLPSRWLLLDRWPSGERIGLVTCPVTIVHGEADEIVPLEHGRALKALCPTAKLITVPRVGHNDLPIDIICNELMASTIGESTSP